MKQPVRVERIERPSGIPGHPFRVFFRCTSCSGEVSIEDKYCRFCGSKFDERRKA